MRQDPKWRKCHSEAMKQHWADPEYRERVSAAISRSKLHPERVGAFRRRIKDMWEDREFREQHTGENHAAWRGGTARDPYTPEFRRLRPIIRERDGFACLICGEGEHERAHDVHHCDYDRSNDDEANLVTLCRPHHAKTNYNRDAYRIAFQTLMGTLPETYAHE